jgi:hypothetical protein
VDGRMAARIFAAEPFDAARTRRDQPRSHDSAGSILW